MGDEFALKYMGQVVGINLLREKLCLDVLEDKLSHACILEGPRGTGKHTIAKNVAAALACRCKDSPTGEFPCCQCPDCKKVLNGDSPDLITVGRDGKATLGVESIRFLKDDVRLVPNDLDFKVYVIEDADKMTVQAQNAFLLTLEEPPAYVRFFLLCENSDLLLETIRSRAPVIRTQPIDNDELDSYLCKTDTRAAQLKLASPTDYKELIAASKHGIGTAIEYLDPKVFAPIKELRRLVTEFADAATSGERSSVILPLLFRFSQKREQLAPQLEALSEAVTDLIMLKNSDNAVLRFFCDKNKAMEMCDKVSISFLYTLGNAVLTAIDSIQKNANVRLTLVKLVSDAKLI